MLKTKTVTDDSREERKVARDEHAKKGKSSRS
jgi:hypothetical protein